MPTVDPKIMELAIEVAKKSKPESDNRTHPKVGVVVVKNGKVLATGCRENYAWENMPNIPCLKEN